MKALPLLLATLLGAAVSSGAAVAPIHSAQTPYPSAGSIERLDPAFDALVPSDAKIEKLAEGFNWSEGPVWDREHGVLLFSDVPENRVYQWKDGAGVSVYLEPSGFTGLVYTGTERGANGLTFDRQGHLVLCQHGDRRVARLAANGKSFETVVDRIEGKKFSSPNDLCFDRAGNLFFTDPPYGLPRDVPQETEFNGVYRLGKDGKLTVIARDMERPNGIALSPDERTLYVGSTQGSQPFIKAYTLNASGAVTASHIFFDSTALTKRTQRSGGFDGLKVDTKGNLWATGPGGVLVLDPTGKHLGTLLTERGTANCAFGGADGRTLFITADDLLLRVATMANDAGR